MDQIRPIRWNLRGVKVSDLSAFIDDPAFDGYGIPQAAEAEILRRADVAMQWARKQNQT